MVIGIDCNMIKHSPYKLISQLYGTLFIEDSESPCKNLVVTMAESMNDTVATAELKAYEYINSIRYLRHEPWGKSR
jgi:hypothetical protein